MKESLNKTLLYFLQLTHADKPRVLNQLLETQYKKSYTNIFGSMGVALFHLFGVKGALFSSLVWCWFIAQCLLNIIRYKRLNDFAKTSTNSRNEMAWYQEILGIHILSGLLWGLTPFIFFDLNNEINLFVFFAVSFSVLASSVVLINLPAGYLVSSFLVMPMIGYAAFLIDNSWNLLTLLVLFYFVMMLFVSIESNRSMADAVTLRFKNEDLAKKLEASNLAKSKFLATASHDLRQPIQALSLLTAAANEHGQADKQTLHSMQRSIDNLNILFNSLLDVSKLDSGIIDVKPKKIDLKAFISGIHGEFHEITRHSTVKFNYFCPDNTFVYTDPTLTQRILINLITNALKYTSKGSVEIRVEKRESTAVINVTDTGTGIPKDKLEAIFEEFYQLNDEMNTAQKGMGLGLSIVKRLAEMQNYSIKASSALDKGSTFSFSIPLSNFGKKQSTDQLHEPSSFDASKHNILIIEDEPDILEAMALLLTKWKYNVFCASNSIQAKNYMQNTDLNISLLLSDYGLGEETSGVEICKSLVGEKKIPAIIITGSTLPEHIQNITQNDMLLITKPIIPGRLRVALESLLKQI